MAAKKSKAPPADEAEVVEDEPKQEAASEEQAADLPTGERSHPPE